MSKRWGCKKKIPNEELKEKLQHLKFKNGDVVDVGFTISKGVVTGWSISPLDGSIKVKVQLEKIGTIHQFESSNLTIIEK